MDSLSTIINRHSIPTIRIPREIPRDNTHDYLNSELERTSGDVQINVADCRDKIHPSTLAHLILLHSKEGRVITLTGQDTHIN